MIRNRDEDLWLEKSDTSESDMELMEPDRTGAAQAERRSRAKRVSSRLKSITTQQTEENSETQIENPTPSCTGDNKRHKGYTLRHLKSVLFSSCKILSISCIYLSPIFFSVRRLLWNSNIMTRAYFIGEEI